MMRKIIQGTSIILLIPIFLMMLLALTFSADADDIIAKYKKRAPAIESLYGLKLKKSFSEFGLYAFEVPSGESITALISNLKKHPKVEYAEPNFVIETQAQGHYAMSDMTQSESLKPVILSEVKDLAV